MVFIHISRSIIPNGSPPGPAHGATAVGEDSVCDVLKVGDNDGLEGVFLCTQSISSPINMSVKDSIYVIANESFSTYRRNHFCNILGSCFALRPPK